MAASPQARKAKATRLVKNNRLGEAQILYAKICKVDRDDAEAWFMLGAISSRLGKWPEAVQSCRRASVLAPENGGARFNFAVALNATGQFAEAATELRATLSIDRRFRDAWSLLGRIQGQLNHPQTEQVYAEALEIFPGDYRLHADCAGSLRQAGKLEAALAHYRLAIDLSSDTASLHEQMAGALSQQGEHELADRAYRKGLALDPDNRLAHSNWLLHQHYLPRIDAAALRLAHGAWPGNKAFTQRRCDYVNNRDADRRLRVAYISADFRTHSVAYYVANILRFHRRAGFEVFVYADVSLADAMTGNLQALADQWRVIAALDEPAIAAQIEQDRIDILVDLAGHTSSRILSVMARQPAPVQVTYLGYPDTTGLGAMDYRLTDAVADPAAADAGGAEQLVRLPGCFLSYRASDEAPAAAPLPALENGYITFGSFNNRAKINAEVIALWAQVLARVPLSRLYLKNPSLDDAQTRQHLQDLFARSGISSDRVELQGREQGTGAHLGRYAKIDIGLDTFPYCGTTTTCEALWMGVPVVTLVGAQHCARVGASLLRASGLEQYIAQSPEQYVDLCAGLAADSGALSSLRAGLREQTGQSALCDGELFTKGLEQAYRKMWQSWAAG